MVRLVSCYSFLTSHVTGPPQPPGQKMFQGTSQEAPQAKFAQPMSKKDEDKLLSNGSKFQGMVVMIISGTNVLASLVDVLFPQGLCLHMPTVPVSLLF